MFIRTINTMNETADTIFHSLKKYLSLTGRRLTVAAIESATGGKISDRLTNLPGISDFFTGSIVSYSNDSKTGIVGVNKQTIQSTGAVSRQTAIEMAECGRVKLKADICVSVTGIAGPSGGTAQKPVGLFFLGLSADRFIRTQKLLLTGSRDENKQAATEAALIMISDYILGRISLLQQNSLEETHIVNSFVEHKGKILLLKRSSNVGFYKGKWAAVSGHLELPDMDQCLTEIEEEIGLNEEDISLICRGDNVEIPDMVTGQLWNIHPFRFEKTTEKAVYLNFENSDYTWISPEEMAHFDIVPGLPEAWRSVNI